MEEHSRHRDGRTRDEDRRHRHEEHRHRDDHGGHRRRSRSPARKRRRSRSPDHHSSSRRHGSHGDDHTTSRSHRHRERKPAPASSASLPFDARQLTKRDLPAFEHLLADFLFIQKQKDLYEMSDREVKGRWKSFLGKWNRGELAEGWYDPETYARTKARAEEMGLERREVIPDDSDDGQPGAPRRQDSEQDAEQQPDPDDDDDYGPTLPGTGAGKMSGPGIPSRQDLLLRDEQRTEDREQSLTDLRLARKADRHLQKERLDDLVPRADPGSRERKLEKKQAVNDKMRSFRERSPGVGEVAEGELMGGEGDELEEYKREKKKEERKKSEREVRREEMERARREEVEERRRRWKEREEGTVESLRELARQRFGSG